MKEDYLKILKIKKIKIACKGADLLDIDDLKDFQGELKTLSEENYEKLKLDLCMLGFSEPVSVWKEGEEIHILNGHQRIKALKRMRNEGYEVDQIPVSYVYADDIKQAKKKVLALTSQFGEISNGSLDVFIEQNKLDKKEILEVFRFPEIQTVIDDLQESIAESTIEPTIKYALNVEEHHDYVLIVSEDLKDFMFICNLLNIKKEDGSYTDKKTKIGTGRAIKAKDFIRVYNEAKSRNNN